MTEPNNLAATVFVFKHRDTGEIAAHYTDAARSKHADQWEHVATLEPRLWIQTHYSKVANDPPR